MPPQISTQSTRRTLTLDVEKYQTMLDAPEMSAEERRQVLEALWLLVVSFVDLGFEVKSAENACGQAPGSDEPVLENSADMLELSSNLPECFNQKTASSNTLAEGGYE